MQAGQQRAASGAAGGVHDPRNSFTGLSSTFPRTAQGEDRHRVRIHADTAGAMEQQASATDSHATGGGANGHVAGMSANNAVPIRRSPSMDALKAQAAPSAPADAPASSSTATDSLHGSNGSSSSSEAGAALGVRPRMRDLTLPDGVAPYAAPAQATVAAPAAPEVGARPAGSVTGSHGSDNEDVVATADPDTTSRGSSSDSDAPAAVPNSHNNLMALRFVDSIGVCLSGIWVKDPVRSELAEYERCIDLWGLSGVQKQTAKLLEGLELTHKGSQLDVHFLTIIPYFKVRTHPNLARAGTWPAVASPTGR